MSMLIVLLDEQRDVAALDVATANQLARLGVTQVTIARDHSTEAIVLEGWAFDIATHGAEASLLVGGRAVTRSLQPVLQTLITPEARPGGGISDHRQPGTSTTTTGSTAKVPSRRPR
jgi:hypothetical protein